MAWLHATPKPPQPKSSSKRAKPEAEAPRLSRFEQIKKDGGSLAMPPNPAPHITEWFTEVGPAETTGMGLATLSWKELRAWADSVNLDLEPWEFRLLRRLSAEYVAEGRRAEDEKCPAPWRRPITDRERDVDLERLKMLLG